MNILRAVGGKAPLLNTPGIEFLKHGMNKDGYWDYNKLR